MRLMFKAVFIESNARAPTPLLTVESMVKCHFILGDVANHVEGSREFSCRRTTLRPRRRCLRELTPVPLLYILV